MIFIDDTAECNDDSSDGYNDNYESDGFVVFSQEDSDCKSKPNKKHSKERKKEPCKFKKKKIIVSDPEDSDNDGNDSQEMTKNLSISKFKKKKMIIVSDPEDSDNDGNDFQEIINNLSISKFKKQKKIIVSDLEDSDNNANNIQEMIKNHVIIKIKKKNTINFPDAEDSTIYNNITIPVEVKNQILTTKIGLKKKYNTGVIIVLICDIFEHRLLILKGFVGKPMLHIYLPATSLDEVLSYHYDYQKLEDIYIS